MVLAWGCVLLAPLLHCSGTASGAPGFVVHVDLDGDGSNEVVVGIQATRVGKVTTFEAPGDVLIFRAPTDSLPRRPAFACRSHLPTELSPWFFEASVVGAADLDGDGLPELVLVWLGESWWPLAYRPLAVVQFDPVTRSYEMIIDRQRFIGEIGAYAVVDADADGAQEILEIDPVYGTEGNPATGASEPECHHCPHRYRIRALEFTGERFVVDPRFHQGVPYVTASKYLPSFTPDGSLEILPQLLALVAALASWP